MSNTEPRLRKYKNADYEQCEALVNSAWSFDKNFRPQELANLAKYMYTKGSVKGSNYRNVIEVNGKVIGFIFGLNEAENRPGRNIIYGLGVLWRLFRIKNMERQSKKKLLSDINTHEINRSKVVDRGRSEIILFVVGKDHQGFGYGKALLSDFLSNCKNSGIKSVIVETNKLGASSFYEKVGFEHIADFDSPLHEYATKGGQACLYEYMFN